MKANIGTIDRVLRLALGAILIAMPFLSGMALFGSNIATTVAIIAGIVLIGTSAVKFCPIYRIVGLRTCKI